jgi:hypothetical protein
MTNYKVSQPGYIFVLTEKGYNYRKQSNDDVKAGQTIPGYETMVPVSWIENGWVEEREETDVERN